MGLSLSGLRTVIYAAPDLDAAKVWWTELLGFGPYFDQPFYVGYEVAGYELGLLPDGDPRSSPWTYWGVEDCQVAVAAAVALGATVEAAPDEKGEGSITSSVRTPDGSIVGFIYHTQFRRP